LKNSKEAELEHLRTKVLGAVRFSKRFWMTFREGTFGIATIVNLIYKKSYIEVLFFTNADVIERGVPLLKINSPLEDEIDFNELIMEPDFDDDGLVSPSKIIDRMRRLIRREFQKHLAILNEELHMIDEKFENYPLNKNPYYREIIITFPDFTFEMKINFEKYPYIPIFSFSRNASRILKEKLLNDSKFIQNWEEYDPPHIYELIETIYTMISENFGLSELSRYSQFLSVNKLTIENVIQDISFKIHKGKSIGVILEEEQVKHFDHRIELLSFFEAISGLNEEFSGEITVFGTPIKLLSEEDRKRIFIIPQAYEANMTKMRIKKAVKYNLDIQKLLTTKKNIMNKKLRETGISLGLDDIMENILLSSPVNIRTSNKFIKSVLENTGLGKKTNKRFSELNPLEFLLFSISRALIQNPVIIMFSIPTGMLGKFDYAKFNSLVDRIKEKFHIVLIIHGPEEVVSNCDEILTITKNLFKIGTYDDYLEEMPRSGEILTIELNNPNDTIIKQFFELTSSFVVVEERKNEKYKIFINEDPNKIIISLIKLFKRALYSFKRSKARLSEYLEYIENK
jgi:ABC-type multidrug transport system ATPase subunit